MPMAFLQEAELQSLGFNPRFWEKETLLSIVGVPKLHRQCPPLAPRDPDIRPLLCVPDWRGLALRCWRSAGLPEAAPGTSSGSQD